MRPGEVPLSTPPGRRAWRRSAGEQRRDVGAGEPVRRRAAAAGRRRSGARGAGRRRATARALGRGCRRCHAARRARPGRATRAGGRRGSRRGVAARRRVRRGLARARRHCTCGDARKSRPLATWRGAPERLGERDRGGGARRRPRRAGSRSSAISARDPVQPHPLAPPVAAAVGEVRRPRPSAASASSASPSPTASAARPSRASNRASGASPARSRAALVDGAGPRRAGRAGGRRWPGSAAASEENRRPLRLLRAARSRAARGPTIAAP